MTQEIVYTSAPQGLKPGSKGFCTVVSTDGMSGNLSERLEMLSGYRHAFAPGDRNAPVNYAHLHIKVSGRFYYVLSRICDAGLDYSQRSNKLAHHVAFADDELVAAGPAAVLAQSGFCETQWNGTVTTHSAGRSPNVAPARPSVCHQWQQLTGDAGWAAVLAHSATVARPKPVSVIFPPGTSVLPLVVEAMNLIPPSRRWEVTFSTYFTKAIAGSDCLWRFVLDGTSQADALRKNPSALVIDLGSRLSPPPENAYLNSARTGAPSAEYSDHFAVSAMPGSTSARPPARMKAYKAPQPEASDGDVFDEADGAFGSHDPYQAMPAMPPLPPRVIPWYKRTISLVIGGIIVLASLVGVALTAYQMGRNSEMPMITPTLQPPGPDKDDEDGEPPAGNSAPPETTEDSAANNPDSLTVETTVVAVSDPTEVPTLSETVSDFSDPFAVYSDEQRDGVLPFYLSESEVVTRRPLHMKDLTAVDLEVHAVDPGIDSTLTLHESALDEPASTPQRIWTVTLKARGGGKDTDLGSFRLDGEDLVFERAIDSKDPRFNRFLYSVLIVSVNNYSAAFALGAPVIESVGTMMLAKSKEDIQTQFALPPSIEGPIQESLRFDIVHPAFNGFAVRSLRSGDRFVVGFQRDGQIVIDRSPREVSPVERAAQGILADLTCTVSIETSQNEGKPDETPVTRLVLKVIPSIYLKLLRSSDPVNLGKRFLQGDPELILDDKRFEWDMEIAARHLAADQGESKIRGAIRREFNGQVKDGSVLDQDADDFWTAVLENIDSYYESPPPVRRGKRQEFKTGLEALVRIVSNYQNTLNLLTDITDRFHANELHIRCYTVVNGYAVDVVQTRGPDERN